MCLSQRVERWVTGHRMCFVAHLCFFRLAGTACKRERLSLLSVRNPISKGENRSMSKNKSSAWVKWMTLIIVAIAGGLITKLPYLRETYMAPLQQATGATKTQLGMLMSCLLYTSRCV